MQLKIRISKLWSAMKTCNSSLKYFFFRINNWLYGYCNDVFSSLWGTVLHVKHNFLTNDSEIFWTFPHVPLKLHKIFLIVHLFFYFLFCLICKLLSIITKWHEVSWLSLKSVSDENGWYMEARKLKWYIEGLIHNCLTPRWTRDLFNQLDDWLD